MSNIFRSIGRRTKPNTIDDFKAVIGKRGGLAKTNRFNVIMTPPASKVINTDWSGLIGQAISGNLGLSDFINDPRDVAMLCESTQLPGRTINTIEHEHETYRQTIKTATGYVNEDVTLTFHLTNDYYLRKVKDTWITSVVNPNSYTVGWRTGANSYTSDITIQQLNEQNVPVYGVRLLEAYPISISPIQLDNNASGTTQKISITFTYTDYLVDNSVVGLLAGGSKGFLETLADGAGGVVGDVIGGVSKIKKLKKLF